MNSMSKSEAIEYMIKQVEQIEKDRIAEHFSIDPNKLKKEATDKILKVINDLEIKDEDK